MTNLKGCDHQVADEGAVTFRNLLISITMPDGIRCHTGRCTLHLAAAAGRPRQWTQPGPLLIQHHGHYGCTDLDGSANGTCPPDGGPANNGRCTNGTSSGQGHACIHWVAEVAAECRAQQRSGADSVQASREGWRDRADRVGWFGGRWRSWSARRECCSERAAG